MTKSGYKNSVASIGCILCARLGYTGTPAQLHHVREGQGMSQRASDYLVIPLCPEHHTGDIGIHGLGTRAFEAAYKVNELELLADTISIVYNNVRRS
jgi:hypothetical protein